jgi:hypothetical protein
LWCPQNDQFKMCDSSAISVLRSSAPNTRPSPNAA